MCPELTLKVPEDTISGMVHRNVELPETRPDSWSLSTWLDDRALCTIDVQTWA